LWAIEEGGMYLKAPSLWAFITSLALELLAVIAFFAGMPAAHWFGFFAYAVLIIGMLIGQSPDAKYIKIWNHTFEVPLNRPGTLIFGISLLIIFASIGIHFFDIPVLVVHQFGLLIASYLLITLGIITSMGPGCRASIIIVVMIVLSLVADSYIVQNYPQTMVADRILFSTRIVKLLSLFSILIEAIQLVRLFSPTPAGDIIIRGYWAATFLLGLISLYLAIASIIGLLHGKLLPFEGIQRWLDAITDFGPFVPLLIFVISNWIALGKLRDGNQHEESRRLIEGFLYFVDIPSLLAIFILLGFGLNFGLYYKDNSQYSVVFVSGGIAFLVFANVIAGAFVHSKFATTLKHTAHPA
jgi:hypothetical protein